MPENRQHSLAHGNLPPSDHEPPMTRGDLQENASENASLSLQEAPSTRPEATHKPLYKLGYWKGLFSNSEEF